MIELNPPAWLGDALCAQVGGDDHCPETGHPTAAAKRLCKGTATTPGCPVRAECLAYALENDERWGVWGGLGPAERERMKAAAS